MENTTHSKSLAECSVLVVGLGLMGASLALALKGKCAHLFGVDIDPDVVKEARRRGVVERVFSTMGECPIGVDLIVLATPVGAIVRLIQELPPLFPQGVILMDLGSTKRVIIEEMNNLPERFEIVGGHPICGKEKGGIHNADPRLYMNATFVITPTQRTTPRAMRMARELIEALGSHYYALDAETHDRWVASTSHIPYLLANALCVVTPEEAASLVGPGFKSTVRLAPTPLNMILDVLFTNRTNILDSLEKMLILLEKIKGNIEANDVEVLTALLEKGARKYEMFASNPELLNIEKLS